MQSHHFNWLSLFILACLLCADVSARNSRCRSLSILRVRLRPLTVDGGSVLGRWHSWSPVPGFLTVGLNRQCRNCCKMKRERERSGPSQKHGPRGDSQCSGRPTQNLNRSTSKGAVPSKFSWVQWLESGAWRAFAEIKEWQTSIEKRKRGGGRWGNKAMGQRQTE